MDDIRMKDYQNDYVLVKSNMIIHKLLTTVGESGCTCDSRKRVDPVIKLYKKCPMMLTENADVPNGQANGS